MAQKNQRKRKKQGAPKPSGRKNLLRIAAVSLVSLAVWCAACYVCYAYGMRQETGKLAEMLDPDLAEQADSLKWVMAVDEPMTDEQLKTKTRQVMGDLEFQVKCFGRYTNADGTPCLDEKGKPVHISYEAALAQGLFQEPDEQEMKISVTSDPERGWELRVVSTPMGTVTYRSKDESVVRISRIYRADSQANKPIQTPTEAVERARAYYNWGLPFPGNYEMAGVQRQGEDWLVTYHRAVRLKNLPKLRSDCQQVQIVISGADGELVEAQCLDLLLIQVGCDQQPISQQQAEEAAERSLTDAGIQAQLQSADYAVVEPNFIYSRRQDGFAYDPETHLSRAVWNLHYQQGEQHYQVYIDAYTGQPLGGLMQ